MAKKNILFIFIFLLFFIALSYSLLVFSPQDIDLAEHSLTIRDVAPSQTLPFDLTPQAYFLKIKLFKKAGENVIPNVFLNNIKLSPKAKKIKNDYVKLYFDLDRDTIERNNILRIEFEENLPEDILLNISNFKKSITKDITIFPSGKLFSRSDKSIILNLLSVLMLILGVWILVFIIFRKLKNNSGLATLAFAPFIFINFVLLLPVLFGYRIIITPFIFWFILGISVSSTVLFYVARERFFSSKPTRRPNNRNVIFYIISFCIVFSVFYLVCELLTRVYLRYNYPVKIFRVSDNDISYILNPNVELKFANGLVKINKNGYRGYEYPVEKTGGVKRIVFLGDSMVFGFGLNEEETLTEQSSNILSRDNRKMEVINFAVTGYNTHQERLLFERRALPYSPDILVLGFCLNDIGGNLYIPTAFNTLNEIGEFNYQYNDFSILEKMQYFLQRHSYFYQYIFYKNKIFVDKIIRKNTSYKPLTLNFMKWELNQDMIRALDSFKQDVLSIKQICDKNNIKFIIMAYGNELQLEDKNLRKPQSMLEDFCKRNNIYFLDLLPAFEGLNKDKILIDQGHPSSFGNKVLAEYLYDFLKTNNLLN